MLTRVEIKGFRSCEDVVLDNLGGLTALIGRNAAGKTSVLRAIEWAARSATEPEFQPRQIEARWGAELEVSFEVALGGTEFKYTINRIP